MIEDQKTCSACMALLPFSAYAHHPKGGHGLQSACRTCNTSRLQRRRHGLTAADKTQIAAMQDGCALCGRLEPGAKGWVVDHDRSCCPSDVSCRDCRRAVVCQWCNNALGYAFDSPLVLRRMADYLELGTRVMPGIDLCLGVANGIA